MVIRFYESQAAKDRWRPWGDVSPVSGRSYYFGPMEFQGWQVFDSPLPWFRARYEMRHDYLLDLRTEEKTRGITSVDLMIHRLAPMASGTPIPTLVPPPPTAPIPIAPGSVRTQEPGIPLPLPTAP